MAQTSTPLTDGQTLAIRAGSVIVAVQCIRPNAAYRLSIRNTDGFEITELSRSFGGEDTARNVARVITVLLRGGYSVAELIALASLAQEVGR